MRYFLILYCSFLSFHGVAQHTIPLTAREVSGDVRDSLNQPVIGATVSLFSNRDTIHTATDESGRFKFADVFSSDFLLTVKALGHAVYNRKYYNNDTKARLFVPLIRLDLKIEVLEEVAIQGLKGPQLKGDTTEFWARDYIVRDYARLEDLLRRMEGITIDSEGSVFHNGQRVVKALFNNETYFEGSVGEAMKELPADIVERVQIIDRNVDGTSAKSMKTDETAKVMNIVTKVDKSAGQMYNSGLLVGTQERIVIDGSLRKIDGGDQQSVNIKYGRKPEGLKSEDPPGTLGGSIFSGFRGMGDQNIRPYDGWNQVASVGVGKSFLVNNLKFNPNYGFTYSNIRQQTKTYMESFYEAGSLTEMAETVDLLHSRSHRFMSDYQIGNLTKRSLSGSISLNYSLDEFSNSTTNERHGLASSVEERTDERQGSAFRYGFSLKYQDRTHPRILLSSVLDSRYSHSGSTGIRRTDVFALSDGLSEPDISVLEERTNKYFSVDNSFRNTATWTATNRLTVRLEASLVHSTSLRDLQTLPREGSDANFQPKLINYQRVNTYQLPIILKPEFDLGKGFFLSPQLEVSSILLAGKLNPRTGLITRFDALWNPDLAFHFRSNQAGVLAFTLSQKDRQPLIDHLNPDPFYQTPFYVRIGDPVLRNRRNQTASLRYNVFARNAQVNIVLLSALIRYNQEIVADRTLYIDPEFNTVTTTIRYRNTEGGNQWMHSLGLSKTIDKIKTTANYTGSYTRSERPYYVSAQTELRTTVTHNHQLDFLYSRLRWCELTSTVQYRDDKSISTLASATDPIYQRLLTAKLKLNFALPKGFGINTDLSQSLQEATNLLNDKSRLVLNANIEKRIFKKKDGVVSFVMMDIAREDAFTNFISSEMGYTTSPTNQNSRYFMVQFSWKPQIWERSKLDRGKGRRGDGSYM